MPPEYHESAELEAARKKTVAAARRLGVVSLTSDDFTELAAEHMITQSNLQSQGEESGNFITRFFEQIVKTV